MYLDKVNRKEGFRPLFYALTINNLPYNPAFLALVAAVVFTLSPTSKPHCPIHLFHVFAVYTCKRIAAGQQGPFYIGSQ